MRKPHPSSAQTAPAPARAGIEALIMTVGLAGDQGGDVLDALQLDLEQLRPRILALIASPQSMANARRMIERSGLPPDRVELCELANAHDIDEVFRATNELVRRLIARGLAPSQIAVNYTSGTKVMGSGAVLSAVFNRIQELRYITGLASVREGAHARHRILTTKPGAVFAYQQLLAARAMLRELRFLSARATLEQMDEDLLEPEDRRMGEHLRRLAEAYEEWDNFRPERFLALYRGLEPTPALAPFCLDDARLQAVEALAAEKAGGRPGPWIVTDLYNNGLRRLQMGATEDALARLYRTLEMLAQWVLARDHQIDTNDVDTRRIPPRDRVSFEALRSIEDGLVKIGLRKSYELLVILKTPLGEAFAADPVMRQFLDKRSETILAHGLHPATPEEARRFLQHARRLFAVEIDDFDRLARLLQFPWLAAEPAREAEGV